MVYQLSAAALSPVSSVATTPASAYTPESTISGESISYRYSQISGGEAKVFYVAAALAAGGGAVLYAATYFTTERSAQASRYASRAYDYVPTTY